MHKLTTLPNGLRLITAPIRGTSTATVLVMVGTGSRYETRANSGISHFLEHLFFKGTEKRPTTLALSGELDSLGAEFNAFTAKEYTGYYIKTDAKKIKKGIEIVSDMLLNSKFKIAEINRERGVIIEEMNMYRDNPIMRIEDVFEECLYGDTPAGWDTIGTKDNILKFSRRDFLDYLNAQYSAGNTIVILAGRFGPADEAGVSRYFSSDKFSRRGQKFRGKDRVRENQAGPAIKISYKKTDQAHLSLGVRTFGYAHSDRLAAKLLAVILGGSMSSRLFINLRERRGLAYYVRTDSEHYTDSGYLTTRAGMPTDKIGEAVKIILNEYKKIKDKLAPREELERARDMLKGRTTIQLESSDAVAGWYGRQAVILDAVERTDIKRDRKKSDAGRPASDTPLLATPESYFKRIAKITPADIRRVARDIFNRRGLNLAAIGPYKGGKKFKGLLKL